MDDPGINGGPSVGVEDSKFLLESSLNQNSISMREESKFSAGVPETAKKTGQGHSSEVVSPADHAAQQSLGVEHFASV